VIWSLIPAWVKRALAGVVAAAAVFWAVWKAGQRDARQKAAVDRATSSAKAAQKAKGTRHELDIADDQRLADILSGKLHNGKR
jgi:hypothetical protein